jgi:hypothetical protein
MPETATEVETAAEAAENEPVEAAVAESTEEETESLGDAGKTVLHKEREARRKAESARKAAESRAAAAQKAADALAAKVKEFEDRDKSESEKQQEAIAAAKKAAAELAAERDKAATELLRYRVGMSIEDFPPSLIQRLQGETEEEMAEDAKRLMDDLGANKKTIRKAPTTSPGLKSGASAPGDHPADGKERAAQALREYRRGGR